MARDPGLEELLREELAHEPDLRERPMFGGLAWLLAGNLLCAARHDGLLVRLGKDADGWALAHPDVGPMHVGARPMNGWVRAGPDAFGDDGFRGELLSRALAFVRALPPK